MLAADLLKYATIIFLVAVGVWFSTAQSHFNRDSRTRPLLLLMVGVSLVATVLTMIIVIPSPVPLDRNIVTLVMGIAAAALIKWALRSINRKNLGLVFSGIVPDEVVQHGPYRHIRHPLYTAYSIFWLSCAVFSASVLVGILAIVLIVIYILAARAEEKDLMGSSLGPSYRTYRERTGLLLPRFFR